MTSEQQNLFDTNDAPWEVDADLQRLVATVVLRSGPGGEFDYMVPEALGTILELGSRVEVPFGRGNRLVIGYCVRLETRCDPQIVKLKSIGSVLDRHSLLSPSMLRLTRWMAEYYLTGWGQVLEAVLPAAVRGQAGTRNATVLSVASHIADSMDGLKLPDKQAQVLMTLGQSPRPVTTAQLSRLAKCTASPINSLRKKGLIEAKVERIGVFEYHAETQVDPTESLELNSDQEVALRAIHTALNAAEHQTLLIHGVTGSGKTEIYLQAIETVIGFGRQAICLVPEISLTPQTTERFRARLGQVAVLHSHLSDAERYWHWQQIADGDVQVVVGARSAVFAPVPHLGLIILDEEHETTFKQDSVPRYHARDVARWRAEAEGIPLILGSATPSLESWHRAKEGTYRLVELPRRVMHRPLPDVVTIDLRIEGSQRGARGAISRQLHAAMHTALQEGGQVILLLNRRGFSTHIQCPKCGEVVKCPDCDIALTHHRTDGTAICHYCDYQTLAPQECPNCKFSGIRYWGIGTQRLESEVRSRFPKYECFRMDTDSMQRPGSHERALSAFRRGDIRILLGTQMIAKGLDFPDVTLVGVINADSALHFPDFRAAERTFHLVTQVAGRTGRGEKGGRVLVQTFQPDHMAIQAAVRHDYQRFARGELPLRKEHDYPPFSCMVRLVIRGVREIPTAEFAKHVAELLRAAGDKHQIAARVIGPAPAPITKLRGKFRFQIQVHARDGQGLRTSVRDATQQLKTPEDVQWIVDVDPIDMM